ncbi:MAG: hypothetical protein EOM21_15950 [Gammaproteobacteria bacterium]|nr:hypothetical protein [Gammaproteobacteria bacterium]
MKSFLPFTGFEGYGYNVVDDQYRNFMKAFAQAYTNVFAKEFEDLTGIQIGLAYKELYVPKEFNWEHERILAEISIEDVEKLFEEASIGDLTRTAKALFTSYSGFYSFYDPNWRTWPPDLSDWDENQIFCLLLAFIEGQGITEYEFEQRVVESGNLHEVAYQFKQFADIEEAE